jgi:hypothetical protein
LLKNAAVVSDFEIADDFLHRDRLLGAPIRIDSLPFDGLPPPGRVGIHDLARRAILDALAPADRLVRSQA